jgi:hypothetical protein
MNLDNPSLSHHPAPHRHRAGTLALAFGLLGGPVAWFAQLCAGSALSDWPCFPGDQHRVAPVSGSGWTTGAIGAMSLAAFAVAICAMLVSLHLLRRTADEARGGHGHLLEAGTGRTRFLALWGALAGAAFAVATAFTAVGYFTLPRCGG